MPTLASMSRVAGDGEGRDSLHRAAAVEDLRSPSRPLLRIEPRQRKAGLVIILHGAGGSARCFQDLAEAWASELPHVKVVMPTAPVRGAMTAWFGRDRRSGALVNYQSLWSEIVGMIKAERVPISRVVLLGFSAGALMASWVALNLPKPCGGLVLLSGLAHSKRLPEPRLAEGVAQTPVLYCVGSDDAQIPPHACRGSCTQLQDWGFDQVQFVELPGMGHEVNEAEADLVLDFLRASLPDEPADPAEARGERRLADNVWHPGTCAQVAGRSAVAAADRSKARAPPNACDRTVHTIGSHRGRGCGTTRAVSSR